MRFYGKIDYVWFIGVVLYAVFIGSSICLFFNCDVRVILIWIMGMAINPLLIIWIKDNKERERKLKETIKEIIKYLSE
jgi:hypothetical protein